MGNNKVKQCAVRKMKALYSINGKKVSLPAIKVVKEKYISFFLAQSNGIRQELLNFAITKLTVFMVLGLFRTSTVPIPIFLKHSVEKVGTGCAIPKSPGSQAGIRISRSFLYTKRKSHFQLKHQWPKHVS
jgi:hypothetical protein